MITHNFAKLRFRWFGKLRFCQILQIPNTIFKLTQFVPCVVIQWIQFFSCPIVRSQVTSSRFVVDSFKFGYLLLSSASQKNVNMIKKIKDRFSHGIIGLELEQLQTQSLVLRCFWLGESHLVIIEVPKLTTTSWFLNVGFTTLSYLRVLFNLFQVLSNGSDLNPSFKRLVEFSCSMWRNSTTHKSLDFYHPQDFHNVRSSFYFFWRLLFLLDLYGFKDRDWGQYRLFESLSKMILPNSFESGPSTHFSISVLNLLYGYYF